MSKQSMHVLQKKLKTHIKKETGIKLHQRKTCKNPIKQSQL